MHKFQGKGTIFLQDNPCLRIKKRRAYFVLPADYTIFASVIKPMIQDDKKTLPDLIAILAFILISFAYFFPADIEGRILFQHDTAAGAGAGQEAKEYYEQTGERTRWTNSLFGGMPTYQIAPSYDSTAPLQWTQKVYQLFLPGYVNLTFILMLGFYILLRVFGIPVWLAGLGGIMWAFRPTSSS